MEDPDRSEPNRPLPIALRWLFSACIFAHLAAIVATALSAMNGPWPTDEGSRRATPPYFASLVGDSPAVFNYLLPLKLNHDYHFQSNRPRLGCRLEAKLRDGAGAVSETVRFPDPKAWRSTRNLHELVAFWLSEDEIVEPPPGEVVPAPNQQVESVAIWEGREGRAAQLVTVPKHLVPRDHPVTAPTRWTQILARSYSRYVCRQTGAASVELQRITRDRIPPDVLFMESPPPEAAYDESIVSFGVLHAEASTAGK